LKRRIIKNIQRENNRSRGLERWKIYV
jgi:hypothetical protein